MTFDFLPALITFAFVSSITPGPNNLMLMASGANYGFRRSLPHMAGISLGHGFMVFLLGLGLLQLFDTFPWLKLILTVICSVYLIYLAYKIATASAPGEAKEGSRPFTFLQAAAFQWVNPKAIYMAITAQTNYGPEASTAPLWITSLMVALAFTCTNLPSVSTWAWMGTQIRRWLQSPARLRAFNLTMAALLVLTLVPVIKGLL